MAAPGPSTPILLEELWSKPGRPPLRLIVWAPMVDPLSPHGDFVVWFQIENLDDKPRPHMQVSAALAVSDAIRAAAFTMFAMGARPEKGAVPPSGPAK
jgi:hypothetical protein